MRYLVLLLLILPASLSGKEITVLYTNDIESVYEPVTAWWRDDLERMGGMPYLASLVRSIRAGEQASVLVDAGDMFTGSLSKKTNGRLVFDLYSSIGYDAVNLGNHEFEYGWQALRQVMQRARFPVLSANVFFEGTEISFGRQYAILVAGDVRIGVIGAMGVDAFTNTIMPANRADLYVRPPAAVLQPLVDLLRPEVDLLLVLTHQNRTAPMQTNKEADPEVQRGFDEDYELAGTLRGVDMIIGGHSDHGLEEPVRHPETGTLIGLTYGQGMHLGYARFRISGEVQLLDAKLIPVNADELPPDRRVEALIADARAAHPELTRVVTRLDEAAPRLYYRESRLGNLLADLLREHTGARIGFMPAGAIRADIEPGDVTVEDVLNVFPFIDRVSVLTLPGRVIKKVLEKSLSLEYGLVQVSGISLVYDSRRPVGNRLVSVEVAGESLEPDSTYTVVTGSFTATGGEGYDMFEGYPLSISETLVSDAFISELEQGVRQVPGPGRQQDLAR